MNELVGQRPREKLRSQEQGYLGLWYMDDAVCLSTKCGGFCIAC